MIGTNIPISKSLKKLISSKRFIIVERQKNISNMLKSIFKKSLDKYLFITKDLNIILSQTFKFKNFKQNNINQCNDNKGQRVV